MSTLYSQPANANQVDNALSKFHEDQDPGGRVFMNVARSGCGSGCLYCYISRPGGDQVPFSEQEMRNGIRNLVSDLRFRSGRKGGTVVSLCPDTEPFKSEESTRLIILIVQTIAPMGNPIQISTKEAVPDSFLKALRSVELEVGQLVIFTSWSGVADPSKVEPRAAPLEKRLQNFHRLRDLCVTSCLYLKPYLPNDAGQQARLVEILKEYSPDSVCVGIMYKQASSEKKFHHPAHPGLSSVGLSPTAHDVIAELKERVKMPIFLSAVCVSGWAANRRPSPRIWADFPALCVGCNVACGATQE